MQNDFFSGHPEQQSAEDNWNWFKNQLNNMVESEVPHKEFKDRTRPPWFNSHMKNKCNKKEKLYIKAVKGGSNADWIKFKQIRKTTDRALRRASRKYTNSVLAEDNPKIFWRYIKSKRSDKVGIQAISSDSGLLTNDRDKAEALAAQFQSVFTPPDDSLLPDLPPSPFPDMPPITVEVGGVLKLLKNIDTSKATGPDHVSNTALKIAAEELAPILQFKYQQSLDHGEVPADWRRAYIAPIHKKGSTSSPANYRPISLTCTCCKLLEHIVDHHLMSHLSKHDILADNQHAFRKHRSCESQLILTTNDLARNLDKNSITDVIALDFSKAFDVIPHRRLLHKLDFYGIRSNTKLWITNFLANRTQCTRVNGSCSKWYPVLSGTPQGTVLGPHLFLLYINDIHQDVSSTTRLFADDCLVYRPINSADDELALQKDLDSMVAWSQRWGMHFNPTKCEAIRVSRKRNPGLTSYSILGVNLTESRQITYLGIRIQNDLRWNEQTHHTATRATGVLNFLRRNFHHCPTSVKDKLYSTIVRPHLEYAVAAWDPYTKKNISSIEQVQRRAARFVTNTYDRDVSVTKLLTDLKWNTLLHRREAHRLTCFNKMLHGQLAIDHTNHIKPKLERSRRGHAFQFEIIPTRTDVYSNSFFPRTIKSWNSLHSSIIEHKNPETFKSKLLHSELACLP